MKMKIPLKKPTWFRKRPSWSWKKAMVGAVGILVVVSLGRGLLGQTGDEAVDTAGPEIRQRPPPEMVDLDGKRVPAAGGPVAVLNPGLARPGATVGVTGSGFDPGATVQVLLTSGTGRPAEVASDKADRNGAVEAAFTFPAAAANAGDQHMVTVQQANSDNVAEAQLVTQAGVATASLSDNTAAPGGTVTVNASGFLSGETINVYWGRVAGEPSATLEADAGGQVSRESIRVGVGPTGESTLVLVGKESQSAAVAPFTMLALYPTAKSQPYSAKAGNPITVSGAGFAPGERVLVYFNEATGTPALAGKADPKGNVSGLSFRVPFGLKGKHVLILIGEQSRASVSTGFSVQEYSPAARANTYGGLPGTNLTFYVTDFAANEAVHVYIGRGKDSQGELVAAFRVNERGSASTAGGYVVPGNAQGKLTFTLVGAKSEGTTTTTVTVDKADGAVNVPPQPKYTLPPELEE